MHQEDEIKTFLNLTYEENITIISDVKQQHSPRFRLIQSFLFASSNIPVNYIPTLDGKRSSLHRLISTAIVWFPHDNDHGFPGNKSDITAFTSRFLAPLMTVSLFMAVKSCSFPSSYRLFYTFYVYVFFFCIFARHFYRAVLLMFVPMNLHTYHSSPLSAF